MSNIRSILARDLELKIKDVIQVGQSDEDVVYSEITDYVATESIKKHYQKLLKEIADSKNDPTEDIGVWVSGFFGSGKSSFAKNLGYVLANPDLKGASATELFLKQVDDQKIKMLLDVINPQIPFHVIMFDVSASNTIRTPDESIAHIMYRQLLDHLGYANDYEIAELEIDLEAENKLEEFSDICREMYERDWTSIRKGMQRFSRASAILHQMDPQTYSSPDSWATTVRGREEDLTVEEFVRRAFLLSERRRPDEAMIFIIDEVGRYVAHSNDKLEILRAVVEKFGDYGRKLREQNKITAPAWIVVTSQEKLEEVVDAIDQTRIDLPHVKDRFPWKIDLEPSDIREVATTRLLAKTEEGKKDLIELYRQHEGRLKDSCRLEDSSIDGPISEEDFVQFYPYLPHYIDMSIDIMSGIRLQPGAPPHLGGSNRTIIKQIYEMLVSEGMADAQIGSLVTLDKIYELVRSNLSDERRRDMDRIQQEYGNQDQFILRVAKSLALLEFVTKTPKTIRNISALLVDDVGDSAPFSEVNNGLSILQEKGYVRETQNGWKLQTAQERTWETERREHSPRMAERHQILRKSVDELFNEARLLSLRYKNLRTFRIGVSLDGRTISDEQLMLHIHSASSPQEFNGKCEEIINKSRRNEKFPYWVFAVTSEVDSLVAEIHASEMMIANYSRRRGQNQISADQHANLDRERELKRMYQTRLKEELKKVLSNGSSVFNGVKRDGAHYGNALDSIIKGFLKEKIQVIYSKLDMGARALPANAAEKLLKSENYRGLPDNLYQRDEGLGLIHREGTEYKPDPDADVAQEIYKHLTHYEEYGENEQLTGKAIETKFTGLGYGWELDLIQLVLAFLFRLGMINVSYKGSIYKDYRNEACWKVFSGVMDFRRTRFIPKKPIDRAQRVAAAKTYEGLTGKTVDLQPQDISQAFEEFAQIKKQQVYQMIVEAGQYQLPFIDLLREYEQVLENALDNSPEDNVYLLVNQDDEIIEHTERVNRIRSQALEKEQIQKWLYIRRVVFEMLPLVQEVTNGDLESTADGIKEEIKKNTYYLALDDLSSRAKKIAEQYYAIYREKHQERGELYANAIQDIQEADAWYQIAEEQQDYLLSPLQRKAVVKVELDETQGDLVSRNTQSSLREIEGDIAAVNKRKTDVLENMQRVIAPDEVIQRVQLIRFFPDTLETEEEIEQAVNTLRERLKELVAKGIKVILE